MSTLRQSRRDLKAPERPLGISLGEAMRSWGRYELEFYEAEHAEKLHGIRVGQRVYYSRAELTALFGEPLTPPTSGPVKNRESVKGPQVSIPQLELPLVA